MVLYPYQVYFTSIKFPGNSRDFPPVSRFFLVSREIIRPGNMETQAPTASRCPRSFRANVASETIRNRFSNRNSAAA